MATTGGLSLTDKVNIVQGLAPVVPSSSTPARINLKDVESVLVMIHVSNAETVTGSAITLQQSKTEDNAGGDEKAIALTTYFQNITAATGAAYTRQTATANTFTTLTTNNARAIYLIPVDPASLDKDNGFVYLRAGTANATNATISVYYVLRMAYGGNILLYPNVRA